MEKGTLDAEKCKLARIEDCSYVRDSIAELANLLESELAKADRSPRKICEHSRSLSDEADHALSHPEVWDEVTYERALSLLKDAAKATEGTPSWENCSRRPGDFVHRIAIAKEARQALNKIGC